MSRSRLSRCLLLAVMLAALAPAGASAQPLAPASLPCSTTCSAAAVATAPAPACLPTCGSDVYVPPASRQDRPNHSAAVALAARQANQASVAGLAARRPDLSDPTAAATARPACLPTCGSASVAPRVTPVGSSALAKVNALKRDRSAPASTPVSAAQTSTSGSSNSGILVRDAAILGLVLLVAGIAVATRHRLRPLGSQPR
jgi:hypothetical protein